MLDEKTTDLLIERLIRRSHQANTYFLKEMGSIIKQIKKLTPSQAHQLVQMLKYGEKYSTIVKKLAQYTNLNIAEIDEIFKKYAKKDAMFNKQFYEYRNIPFKEFEQNTALKTQTMALANVVKNEMYNFTRSNVLGFSITDDKGNLIFSGLKETYNKLLDTALMNVGQGKETFDAATSRILKDIGKSGLKTIDFASGRSMRLDSAITMHLKSRLRELHNETQKVIGEEIGFDGWEISVHETPAPDHEKVQGHQFSITEYEKLNNGEQAKDYNGNTYTLDHDGKNGYRPISEMNCYHYVFSIVLGVSKPQYDDEQLKNIIKETNKEFEYNGKKYTKYKGTQLQRKLETEIRKQKDIQIIAKEADNQELIADAQQKITILTSKYKKLCDASGLKPVRERMRVAGYKRAKVDKSQLI